MILWWIRLLNDFEVSGTLVHVGPVNGETNVFLGNSLERIQQYIDIEHEPEPKATGKPPAHWPSSGDLRVENLFARYSSVSFMNSRTV